MNHRILKHIDKPNSCEPEGLIWAYANEIPNSEGFHHGGKTIVYRAELLDIGGIDRYKFIQLARSDEWVTVINIGSIYSMDVHDDRGCMCSYQITMRSGQILHIIERRIRQGSIRISIDGKDIYCEVNQYNVKSCNAIYFYWDRYVSELECENC